MKLKEFQKWLDSYLNFEKTQKKGIFWLESMRFLAEKLDNPQDKIPCIHIAGSKGKGSVSSMISSILNEAGYKCGIYTSPHISDFRERISTPEGFFPDEVYENAASTLVNLINSLKTSELPGQRPFTWFELVTVYAFLCFSKAGCNFAVYETGLGGRLDSTNILKPVLTVLMPIEKEHVEFLGDTIEKIAFEKAGIIKEKTPCVISRQNYPEAEKVFIKTCKDRNAPCYLTEKFTAEPEYSYSPEGKMNIQFEILSQKINAKLKLLGKVQAENAQTACLSVMKAKNDISIETIENGLEKAFLPGRFEIQNNIILDGAHTVKSIQNTLITLKEVFPSKKFHLLFSCAGDKDSQDIIPLFKNTFETIIFTDPATVRHSDSNKLMEIANLNGIKAEKICNLKEAFEKVKSRMKNTDILLITGSFYLVSEIKDLIKTK